MLEWVNGNEELQYQRRLSESEVVLKETWVLVGRSECVCVCVCKGLDLEELSAGAEGWRGVEDELGELFNRPLKQGLFTLFRQCCPGPPPAC